MKEIRAISADDHVDEIIENHPELTTFLQKRGIMCVQCGEVFWGTLRELVEQKGENIDEIIEAINREIGVK